MISCMSMVNMDLNLNILQLCFDASSFVFSICPSMTVMRSLEMYLTIQSNDDPILVHIPIPSNEQDHPLKHMEHRGIFDSGCSGHMTGNRAHLEDYQELSKVGSVTFGGSKGSISGKGTIRLGNLVFDDVAFVKELGHFNLFSISQICDKKLNVLFTEKECFVVSSDFKMPDENQVLLKVPRQHNMYTFDMKNVDSSKGYTCLLAKASSNEAKLWHRRLGHLNFKNLNKLVKGNLVRGLPSKSFKNDHTCVACQKGKQHKASCKAKIERFVTHPLHTLHMDLFGPTSVRSINHASYCLVITDDCSRFCWVFFLAKKDETSNILKTFIRQIENQLNQKVKIIRSDNGTEFKNRVMLEFCGEKGIKQEFSNARTPQQNGVAERMNRTLIEAARTMLADSHLPTTFWAEAVNTACYTFNRVRVTKPQNKTPYELLFGHKPILSYIRPFGCHVTILNTLSPLGKFDGKSDEGFLVGYSVNSKAFRVYNLVTKRVEVNLHVNFLEEKPNVQGLGHRLGYHGRMLLQHLGPVPATAPTSTNPVNTGSDNLNTSQILGDPNTPVQTRSSLKKISEVHALESLRSPYDITAGLNLAEELYAVQASTTNEEEVKSLNLFLLIQITPKKVYKYVAEILKKFDFVSVKSAVTPMETKAPLAQDEGGPDVDLHLYRSMIGFERIFKYIKGKPKLGLWYPRESPLDLVAYSDSDYAAANLDRKSTTGGCQFLGRRDCYEKKLIQVQKIHTDLNVADLLTKAFDGPRYYLELERMLQAQLGHEKGYASYHLQVECRLVIVGFPQTLKIEVGISTPQYHLSNDTNVKQFWQTATAKNDLQMGPQQLNATIDSIDIQSRIVCQPQPSAAPTPSQPVPTPTPPHVQIPTPPITSTPPSTQPPTLTQHV
ncbi:putative ribonuclease H-like domain-containing protein [Tanacetum coccineum]